MITTIEKSVINKSKIMIKKKKKIKAYYPKGLQMTKEDSKRSSKE